MEEVVQKGKGGWLKKSGFYSLASIVCLFLAAVGGYLERLYHHASLRRYWDPNCSISDAIKAGAVRVGGHSGELIFIIGMASIMGLGLAVTSACIKRGLTVSGLAGLVINGFSFLLFVIVLLAAFVMKPVVVHN